MLIRIRNVLLSVNVQISDAPMFMPEAVCQSIACMLTPFGSPWYKIAVGHLVLFNVNLLALAMAAAGLRATLNACPPAPTDLTDPTLKRISKRFQGKESVHNSPAYMYVAAEAPHMLPVEPVAEAYRTISKRHWERIMMNWRHQIIDIADILP